MVIIRQTGKLWSWTRIFSGNLSCNAESYIRHFPASALSPSRLFITLFQFHPHFQFIPPAAYRRQAPADQRHLGRQVSQIHIHNHRHLITLQEIIHRMVLIQAHHFLSEDQRAADEEALYMGEPAGVLHLPDGTSYGKYI